MPRIVIARTHQELDSLRPAWEDLYRPGEHTLFQSFAWNLAAAHIFSATESPFVVFVETGSGMALIPACTAAAGLSLIGEQLFDYREILAEGDEEAVRFAWEQLAASGPLGVCALRGARAHLRWSQIGFTPEPFVGAPQIRRDRVSADEFAARHHRSARLVRRLHHLGVAFREHPGSDAALVREIYDRKAAQPVPTGDNLFANAARRSFMVHIAASDPGCRVFTLESNSSLVAAIITFRDHDTRRFYTTYYDRVWAHHSPGAALLYETARRTLEQDLDCDLLTGEQAHKTRLATGSVPLFRVHASAEELARIARYGTLLAA